MDGGMSDSVKNKRKNQWRVFNYSLLGFCGVLFILFLLGWMRSEVQVKEDEEFLEPLPAQMEWFYKGTHPVTLSVFGTVVPQTSVDLLAPYSDRVLTTQDLFPGLYVEEGSVLFTMDKLRLNLSIDDLLVEMRELELKREQLQFEAEILRKRIDSISNLLQIAKEALVKQEAQHLIEKKLFQNIETLFEKESVSNTELLRAETKLISSELSLLQRKRDLENHQDNLQRLRADENTNRYELENIENENRSLDIRLADFTRELKKADITADFPATIMEVFVDDEQEVSAGSLLARLRSVDEVELEVTVPDSYFHWLYEGNLLEEIQKGGLITKELDIHLVNVDFAQVFKGGFIKSVGESVDKQTRSLPLIIGRKNPLGQDGIPLQEEELKPGMYCRVSLELSKIPDIYQIPRSAIQEGKEIYYVDWEPGSKSGVVTKVANLQVLYEGEKGYLVRSSELGSKILLITEPLRSAWLGMQVSVSLEEGE